MDILALGAALSVMGALVVGALAFYQGNALPRAGLNRRLGAILSDGSALQSAMDQMEALRTKRTGKVPIISSLLEGKDWSAATAKRLESADMRFTVSEFVALRVFAGLLLSVIALVVIGSGLIGFLAVIVTFIVGFLLPNFWVSMAIGRRVSRLNSQLPEALTLISNSIKAGFGLMQSFEMASREMEHPIATEFRRMLYDINVGSLTEDALQAMADRCGSDDLDIVVTAMLIQQSTGGNLAEILDNVAHTMRERTRIRGEIKTLTSQQMLTGFVIGGLPIVMVFLFTLVNPAYMDPLFTTALGNLMLAGACVLEFFGIMLIKRILAIEV